MKKFIVPAALAVLLAASALGTTGSQMVCDKTGIVVESCCCVEKDGQMVCSITGETVSSCCCSDAAE
jgi:hypothetical protein